MPSDLLTIGMATYGEFDSVWFTLTGLTANHPRVQYLVVDNTPERDPRTESITRASGGMYLHRPDLSGTSKPRDAVFRYAQTPWVMCIDSHVILETGAVQAALDYATRSPDSRDLIQGPMVYDDGQGYSTHWNQPAPPGLWGTWDRDPRAEQGTPFEITMMGLGLWMMRKDAWPGFNPLFRGFGGEEGYTHESVRRRGGKCFCLPALRWRHKFRDVSGWNKNPAPPYPLRLEDHVWNLLVGHRELGIDATSQIHDHFGKRLPKETWEKLVTESEKAQPFGGPRPEVKRQKILALWYSDNTAPHQLLNNSARSVMDAAGQTLRHDVTVSACSWRPVAPFSGREGVKGGTGEGVKRHNDSSSHPFTHTPFHPFILYAGQKRRGYDTIIAQIRQAVAAALHWKGLGVRGEGRRAEGDSLSPLPSPLTPPEYDAVAFCEHDVLYPPNYFDRIGDALALHPDAPVVSNLDYIGLNGTGWQKVKERHEPLHQLTLRWDVFQQNLARAEGEARTGLPVILEPEHGGERKSWVRLPASNLPSMSSVHVNHNHGRFTGHGDVCYHPQGYSLNHPHWGEAKQYWPGPMEGVGVRGEGIGFKGSESQPQIPPAPSPLSPTPSRGCSACEADKHQTLESWAAVATSQPSDFHEHVPTLKELAANCEHATELSAWMKPADVAITVGLGQKGKFVSVCRKTKPQWKSLAKHMGERFRGIEAEAGAVELEETDLLFIDTEHTADALYPLLEKHHSKVRKYLAVHCTETYGENGDASGRPGVMHALRSFCMKHQEWVVKRRDENNHGLMVLSRCPEDVKELPSLWRKAMNYTKAMARHVAAGRPVVSLEVLEERQGECAICPERALDACAACGCPLEKKLPLASETCGLVKKGLPPKWGAIQEAAAVAG